MAQEPTKQSMVNGVNTSGLKETVAGIKANPELGQCTFRVRNQWVDGDENRSETCDFYAAGGEQKHKKTFHFQAGEPTLIEGHDEGANPVEYLLSGLSGCMTTTIAYHAAMHGYTIHKMDSTYEGDLNLQGLFDLDPNVRPGYQKIRVHFNIQTDAPAEELATYYPFSPVYDVVSKSVPIEVVIDTYQ